MPPVVIAAGIGAAGMVASSAIGSSASKKAAETQKQAAQETATSAQNIYNQQAAVNKPYVEAGLAGQGQLMNYLGVGGDTGAQDYGKYATAEYNLPGFDPSKLVTGTFGANEFAAQQDPGYAFRMSEGLKALDKTAAARGGSLSGAALKGATAYGQGMASDEYQNAFNRYQTQKTAQMQNYGNLFNQYQVERSNTLNPYQQLQGVGQAAAAGQAANLGSLGSAQQQAITGAANATSAGTMAGANIAAGGINSAVNYLGRQSAYSNSPYANWTVGES